MAPPCVVACRAQGMAEPGPAGVADHSDGAVTAPAPGLSMVSVGPGEVGIKGAIYDYLTLDKLDASMPIVERVARA